jgi:molybdate/tungstate transport system substrate-binding protein
MTIPRHSRLLAALALALALCACGAPPASGPQDGLSGTLTIFHAGSLSVPMKEMAAAFTALHPGVTFQMESAGSRDCARKISDLGKACDVMASADYLVIDQLLIPEHAAWNVKFATNELSIVYHQASRRSQEISAANWTEILLDPQVAFGRADPNADPCGYRSVLCMKLAEQHLAQAGLAESLLAKDTQHIRPKEVDLLALLESNTIDYLFLYRSVAHQHGLKYLILPDEVNLKSPAFSERYASVSVELSGKTPGSTIVQRGEPMVYGVTIPKNASNPAAAEAFVAFLLGPQGRAIMEAQGQPSAVPSPTSSFAALPEVLKPFALAQP